MKAEEEEEEEETQRKRRTLINGFPPRSREGETISRNGWNCLGEIQKKKKN